MAVATITDSTCSPQIQHELREVNFASPTIYASEFCNSLANPDIAKVSTPKLPATATRLSHCASLRCATPAPSPAIA